MSNIIKMEVQESIRALKRKGWSDHRISRELGVNRRTVKRYGGDSKCTNPQTGKKGPESSCERHREWIKKRYEDGLSIERIHRDLQLEHGFEGSYHSVYRLVQALEVDEAKRVFRMECEPGQEAQIDYGTLNLPIGENGRRKKVHFLLVTLSHSRKSYVEAVLRQDAESFLRSVENAFRFFGGVPGRMVPDNLKAAVIKPDFYEPELNPKLRDFAAHYGTVILPARPHKPTDKGKVESGVKYVKNNALKGKSFGSLAEVNEHLRWWLENVADKRIHGTTKRQVGVHFEEVEKPALKALPDGLFPCFEEAPRKVHRDSYVEVKGAYYEVPAQYIGKEVWARWDAAMVRVFNLKMEQIAAHARLEKGRYSHVLGAGGCRGSVKQSTGYYRKQVIPMGEHTLRWADTLIASDQEGALRRVRGLLGLKGRYPPGRVNEAARKACIHGQYTLKELRLWIEAPQDQETFSFLQQHELIRNPKTYDGIAATGDLFD
jgi:transposase